MADSTKLLANALIDAIREADKKKTSPRNIDAEVIRIENDIAWVRIPGNDKDTPVKLTINARPGDIVQVRIEKGSGWIAGNATNPPTDDRTALYADRRAREAYSISIGAEEESRRAKEAADRAEISSQEAQISADNARNSAIQANTHANSALTQLSVVEEVVDTLNWITDHGNYVPARPIYVLTTDETIEPERNYYSETVTYFPTTDTAVNPKKEYYERSGEDPDYVYTKVREPRSRDIANYYEAERSYDLVEEPVEGDLPTYYIQALDYKTAYFIYDDQGVFLPVNEPMIEHISNYYQLEYSEAVTTFVSTHLSVTNGVFRPTMDTYPKSYKGYYTENDGVYTPVQPSDIPANYHLTTDTVINSYKTYYTRSGVAPDYVYTIVTHPLTSEISTYYEAYDMNIYYEYQQGGLWVLLSDDSYKVLIANDGFYLYDETGRMVTSLGSNLILDSDKPQFIGGEQAYILYYDGNGDGIPDSLKIGGSSIELGSDTPLSKLIASINLISRNTLVYDHSYENVVVSGENKIRFTAHLYRGGVDVSQTDFESTNFTWFYKNEDETERHSLGSGYTIDVDPSIIGYGVHIIGRFTRYDVTDDLLNDDGDNLTDNNDNDLQVVGTGNKIKVRNLEKITELEPSDEIMVVTSASEKLVTVQNLSDMVDKHYIHNQTSASATWTVIHNLNKFPTIAVIDSAGTMVIGDVNYINQNSLTISFQSAFSGKAYCN